MKKYLLIFVLAISMVLVACGTPKTQEIKEEPAPAVEVSEETTEQEFTLEELKEFDGKDGRPAYVAVDGVVYDVSNVGGWKGGEHNGVQAGTDATVELKEKSPHGDSKLVDLPVVGKLVEW